MQFSSVLRGRMWASGGLRRPGRLWFRRGRRRLASHLIAAVATLAMVLPVECMQGAVRAALSVPAAVQVADVRLADGHSLVGRVVDDSGRPEPGVSVTLLQAGRVAGSEVTGTDGRFSIAALRGGVYQVVVPRAQCAVRLWEPGTAPPVAVNQLMLVDAVQTVRGQRTPGPLGRGYEKVKYWLADPLVVAGIVAAAVAIPVAVHNANLDRDSGS